MNDHELDHQIDGDVTRVLNAFAATQPPAHLQQRVLASLEQRTARHGEKAYSLSSRTRLFSLIPGRVYTAACALAVIAMVAAFGMLHHRTATPQTASHIQPSVPAPQLAASVTPTAARLAPSRVQTPHRHAHSVDRPTTVIASPAPLDPATCHCDPVALAEASAPSHPAPPLPLTPSERRMLLMLRRGETQELAQLDPAIRARDFQRERADFNRFFAPSSPQHSERKQGNDQP